MAITFPTAADINGRLDELEARLPTVPARLVKFQRTLAAANCDRTSAAFQALADSTKAFLQTARTSGATVTGQARAAAGDVVQSARTGASTVTGQARAAAGDVVQSARTGASTVSGQAAAQGKKVSQAAESQATRLVDRAIDAVDDTPGSGTPYEEWTKAELVERAKELQIVGPTRMSKADLIATLRAAS